MAFQLAGSVTVQNSGALRVTDVSNFGFDARHDFADFTDLYRIFYMDMDDKVIHKQAISLADGWADELLASIPNPTEGGLDYAEYAPSTDAIWKMGIVALPKYTGVLVNYGAGDHYVTEDGSSGLNIIEVLNTQTGLDWYLPSRGGMEEISTFITWMQSEGRGAEISSDFIGLTHWTSTETSATEAYAYSHSFESGASQSKSELESVTACRNFTTSTIYLKGDDGPGGGFIFYIEDHGDGTYTYHEVLKQALDATQSTAWSDITNAASGATGVDIGDGETNTALIIAQQTTTSAAQDCADVVVLVNDISILGNINSSLSVDDLSTWTEVKALLSSAYYVDLDIGVTKANLQSILSELLYRATVTNKAITKDHRTLFNDPDWLEAAKLYLDSVAIDRLVIEGRYDAAQVILDRVEVVTNKYSV